MPLHLYHGPASSPKQAKLHELIKKQAATFPHYRILVPDPVQATQLKAEIITRGLQPSLLGKTVVTWDAFLQEILEHNIKRFHMADQTLCLYLIFLLLQHKHSALLQDNKDIYRLVSEIYHFFIQLKSCGLEPVTAETLLKNRMVNTEVLMLFMDYQQTLEQYHYLDRGDLYLNVLRRIKDRSLKLGLDRLTLFVTKNYPLKPGQREILRGLKKHFPQVVMYVFYDEDFQQEEKILDQAFEDLGQMADESHYVTPAFVEPQPVVQLKNPYYEIDFVVQLIGTQKKQGVSFDRMVLVVPHEDYLLPLIKRLTAEKISHSLQWHLPVSWFLKGPGFTEASADELAAQFKKNQNIFSEYKIKARAQLESFLYGLEFIRTHLAELDRATDGSEKDSFVLSLLNRMSVSPHSFPGQLIITSPELARAYEDRFMYYMGCSLENLVTKRDPILFSQSLYADPVFKEILDSPSVHLKTALEKIKQLLSCSQQVLLTAPEFDFANKPITRLNLGSTCVLKYVLAPQPVLKETAQLARDYFQSKKKTFSLSSLEEYLNCPYRYYASFHLKLDRPRLADIEPAADVKGRFVHEVLQRLIKDDEMQYLEGLEYASYRNKVIARLETVIQQQIKACEDFKNYNEHVIAFFGKRLFKTIVALVSIEAKNYKEDRKKTVPRYYEWDFGNDPRKPYVLETPQGSVCVKGRVDRIDVHEATKQFSVIDYKTGNMATLADIKEIRSLQLPVYLLAVQEVLLSSCSPTGAYYYNLKTNEIKGFVLEETVDVSLLSKRSLLPLGVWQELQDQVKTKIGHIVASIHKGCFDPAPQEESLCRFCDYKRICGYKRG